MASTNKTTNLQLSQFLGTDKPAWLTDYNADMQKIDDEYKKQANDIAGLDGRTTDLETGLGSSNTEIVNIQNDVQSLKDEDVIIKRDINTLDTNYDTIHHEVAINTQEINGIKPYTGIGSVNKIIADVSTITGFALGSNDESAWLNLINNNKSTNIGFNEHGIFIDKNNGESVKNVMSITLNGIRELYTTGNYEEKSLRLQYTFANNTAIFLEINQNGIYLMRYDGTQDNTIWHISPNNP